MIQLLAMAAEQHDQWREIVFWCSAMIALAIFLS